MHNVILGELHKAGSPACSHWAGRYVAGNPQGIQHLLNEYLLEISNEMFDSVPEGTHDHDWFERAIASAIAGDRKYEPIP